MAFLSSLSLLSVSGLNLQTTKAMAGTENNHIFKDEPEGFEGLLCLIEKAVSQM